MKNFAGWWNRERTVSGQFFMKIGDKMHEKFASMFIKLKNIYRFFLHVTSI